MPVSAQMHINIFYRRMENMSIGKRKEKRENGNGAKNEEKCEEVRILTFFKKYLTKRKKNAIIIKHSS